MVYYMHKNVREVHMGLFDKKKADNVPEYNNGELTEVEKKLIDCLKTLRDAGILSREEYYEKKAKVKEIN